MKLRIVTTIIGAFFLFNSLSEVSIAQSEDIVESVEPASVEAGTQNQTFTITLIDLGTPPVPPSEVSPTSIMLGSLEGRDIYRNELVITTVIDIPESETNGFKNLALTFPGPDNNSVSFTKSNAVEVTGGTDPGSGGDLEGEVTLFTPLGNKATYLIDEDGNTVKTWESDYSPALSAYLLDDKSLLRTASLGSDGNSIFGSTGGAGGLVQQFDWDGNLIWEFEHNSDTYLLHHDIEYLPNGNILMIAWEYKSETEAINAGRDPSLLSEGELWPDKIIEVVPEGTNGGTIVWEWHVWDHLIQDYDNIKTNYGVVSEHPEKIDLNFTLNQANADWNHTNAVDYNEKLDQILLTVRSFSEVWIIDHNTASEEAAGSAGDLLYRWGNPQTYGRGTDGDQMLFVPHDGQWIETEYPGENDILIFNNGQGRSDGDYSSVDEFAPPLDTDNNYTITLENSYGPEELIWTYQADTVSNFYANHISGAQRLSNGNTLICEGTAGKFFEVTPNGEIVWEYANPYVDSSPQGNNNTVFRAVRYNLDELDNGGSTPVPGGLTYPIVDTDQTTFYNNVTAISTPSEGDVFYGQDAQYSGYQSSYTDNGDGTVTDNVTGLMWQQSSDQNGDGTIDADDKLSYEDALAGAESFELAGYTDWRLPSIKEAYSLILFSGEDISGFEGTSAEEFTPFIDTDYFEFGYGDLTANERLIDAQFATTAKYVSTTMNGQETMFGTNLADGRIKGYGLTLGSETKKFYVMYVRGNSDYGINDFSDNDDGTISDNATGLMWMQDDNGEGVLWEDALGYAENFEHAGYTDWRLPNIKELQSIIDYTRSPATTSSAAIDSIFNCTQITNEAGQDDYPYFWSGTTHATWVDGQEGGQAAYISFGRAMGYMNSWMDVHGAGAQRSDPKTGDPDDFPTGFGPQGDAIRIYNYVRLVRDATDYTTGIEDSETSNPEIPTEYELEQNYPNPFNPSTKIEVSIPQNGNYTLKVYNILGQEIATLLNNKINAGTYTFIFNTSNLTSGIYFYTFSGDNFSQTKKMILLK